MVAGLAGCHERAGRRVRRCRRYGARQCQAGQGERGNRDRYPGRAQRMPCQAPAAHPAAHPVAHPVGEGICHGRSPPQALGADGDLRGAGRPRAGILGRQVSDKRGDFRGHPPRQWRQRLFQV
jgi:hypothetical protein